MWLNCKVIKKVATPPFLHQPPFLAKNFDPPQVTQFLEDPIPPPPSPSASFNIGGSNYEFCFTVIGRANIEGSKSNVLWALGKGTKQSFPQDIFHVEKLTWPRNSNLNLKETQTSSIYWLYLLQSHVDMSTKSK